MKDLTPSNLISIIHRVPVFLVSVLMPTFLGLGIATCFQPDTTQTTGELVSDSVRPRAAKPLSESKNLSAFPPEILLSNGRDFQSIVVQTKQENGITRDVTNESTITIADTGLIRIQDGVVFPLADGATKLTIKYGPMSAQVPVTVSGSDIRPSISFQKDVMPIFMKTGCNAGSCHGASRGKDGFRLSLFGFDPAGDYHRLTREIPGRRIDIALPEECLLIEKATGKVSHTGGNPISPGDDNYRVLIEWLNDGAAYDSTDVPSVTELKVFPPSAVLQGRDASQQLTVLASYSDGTDRDVTRLAYFHSSNDAAASINAAGMIRAGQRGEAFVMARFGTDTVGIPVVVLPNDDSFNWKPVPENNFIDRRINDKLKKLRIQPSSLCSDREFMRRVSLDICGILPRPKELEEFVNDETKDKRQRLVDRLLKRPEFADLWVMKWAELLQVRSSQNVSYKATLLYHRWLRDQIAGDTPINNLITDILTASGSTFTDPATNFYDSERDTLKITENVAQVFLGMRLQCAQCHNHPFDRWTMDDYYGMAAFFSQIARKRTGNDPRERRIYNRGRGEVKHPVTGKNVTPRFLTGQIPDVKKKDRRQIIADWITSPDNPYFARNLANIVWAHFFGRGVVEPVDDIRVSNPAVNAELLQQLADHLTVNNFDFRSLVRQICTSRTYQLASTTNDSNREDQTNFSHSSIRRIRAEVLLDIISQVTEVPDKFRALPRGAKAVQIADGNTSNYFLNTFGRSTRETVCSCEVKTDPNLSQALHLINGDTIQQKINKSTVIRRQLDNKFPVANIVEDLYLRCLARTPTDSELKESLQHVKESESPLAGLQDVLWALLNSHEFLFNH